MISVVRYDKKQSLTSGVDLTAGDEQALEFGLAASCLKHSVPGDISLVTKRDVLALMNGEKAGGLGMMDSLV